MTLAEIVAARDWEALFEYLEDEATDVSGYIAEYGGDRTARDEQVGNREDKETDEGPVTVNKIPVQFQKKIVRTASSFLFGRPITLEEETGQTEEENADLDEDGYTPFQLLQEHWDKLRLDTLLLQMSEVVKSQTRAAILLRAIQDGKTGEEEKQDVKLKASLLTEKRGRLMPGIDEFGDMLVFVYQIDTKNAEGKDVKRNYVYFDVNVVIVDDDGQDIVELETKAHGFQRIPIVYMSQEEPEWYEVKELIDRFEMMLSKFCDTNDYFASPFFKATGEFSQGLKRDETGKVFMLDVVETESGKLVPADVDVVAWDQAPDAVKLELETIKGLIFNLTDTPDLSFDNVKGMGNISGIALQLMFLAPLLKAKFSEAIYKTAVERLVNVVRAGMVYALNDVSPDFFQRKINVMFNNPLPINTQEVIAMLSEATNAKQILSQKTAVGLNPFVQDATAELAEIEKEKSQNLGETFTP